MTVEHIRRVVDDTNALGADLVVHVPTHVWASEFARPAAPLGVWAILARRWAVRRAFDEVGIPWVKAIRSVRVRRNHLLWRPSMSATNRAAKAQTAIRMDLGAIFASLELSRTTWLLTSLSPGGGERMAKFSLRSGDVVGLRTRFVVGFGFNESKARHRATGRHSQAAHHQGKGPIARTVSGHAIAALPRRAMNSRHRVVMPWSCP
jgi:hypothetical protein